MGTLFSYIYRKRTSNFSAKAEPKLNVFFFFFHVLILKRSLYVDVLRDTQFSKADMNVTRKVSKKKTIVLRVVQKLNFKIIKINIYEKLLIA